jgi:hypothetical protein
MAAQIPAINSARLAQDCFLPSTISEILRQRDKLRALLQQELARASPVRPVRSPLLSREGNYGTSQACQKGYPSRHGANMPLFVPTIKSCGLGRGPICPHCPETPEYRARTCSRSTDHHQARCPSGQPTTKRQLRDFCSHGTPPVRCPDGAGHARRLPDEGRKNERHHDAAALEDHSQRPACGMSGHWNAPALSGVQIWTSWTLPRSCRRGGVRDGKVKSGIEKRPR